MSKRGVRTIALPWRKACVALPVIALIGGSFALAAPSGDLTRLPVSKAAPAIVVPTAALTMPGVPAGEPTREAPGLVLSEGTAPGSPALVRLDQTGIPTRALEAYRRGAWLVGTADPACHIDWALLGAIGRVESNHARFGGSQLDATGVATPGIIGIRLDGTSGTATITDTDGGRLDHDTSYDRAVGPMQFIPSTWGIVGSDANGDGVKNPQNLADAVTATAVYLCSGTGDLSVPSDLRAAIMRYNPSDSYVRTVTAIADAYRRGVIALPASELPAAAAPSKTGAPTTTAKATKAANATRAAKPTHSPGPSSAPRPAAAVTPRAPAAAPPASAPRPVPAVPALPVPRLKPTPSGPPSPPLPEEVCTVNALGVKTCAITLPG